MDLSRFVAIANEKPLDNIVSDGGFCKIFRTIGCIGDSLSSGEFESCDEHGNPGYHDFYEYSWGQYIAREIGSKVYNFSRGGMTAKEYTESFADRNGFWDEEKVCQAYILALGVNDLYWQRQKLGTIADVHLESTGLSQRSGTFAGYYAAIIQMLKIKQPHAKFFFMTMPKGTEEDWNKIKAEHAQLLYDMATIFDNAYVIDLYQYAPIYDEGFKKNFYLAGHMNPAGYVLTAKMVMSYIDYIIRNNPEEFSQVGFIGKPYYYMKAKR